MNELNNNQIPPKKIEESVMSEIKSGRVKLRSRYIFLAEKLGVGSAVTLTVLLAVLFFSLFLFYLKASDNLGYLSFGSFGLFAFLESFPYPLIISFILLIFVAGIIIKKSGVLYKKPFGYLAIGLTVVVVFLGVILTFTGVGEMIERSTYEDRPGGIMFKPFFHPGFENRHNGVAGRIKEIGSDYVVIETPSDIQTLDLSKVEKIPEVFSTGSFITAIGNRVDGLFEVEKIRVIDPDEMPIIRRGINHQFGEPNFLPPQFGSNFDSRVCLEGCAQANLNSDDCAAYCLPKVME